MDASPDAEAQPDVEDPITEVFTPEDFRAAVFESDKPVIVDFWAAWCQPCMRMAPLFAELAERYPAVRFVKVETDRAPEIARLMRIKGLPTFALVWQGEVRDVVVGAQTRKQLVKHVERLVARAEGKGFFQRLLGR